MKPFFAETANTAMNNLQTHKEIKFFVKRRCFKIRKWMLLLGARFCIVFPFLSCNRSKTNPFWVLFLVRFNSILMAVHFCIAFISHILPNSVSINPLVGIGLIVYLIAVYFFPSGTACSKLFYKHSYGSKSIEPSFFHCFLRKHILNPLAMPQWEERHLMSTQHEQPEVN